MIQQPKFEVDPWAVREAELDLERLAQSESVFALGNGHIGLRANLDEGEPHGLPGTYLGGFFESRPLVYGESAYGFPEAGQTVVNVTNGKVIRLLVGDEPFDVRYGELRSHARELDFRAGALRREVEWVSPAGQTVEVSSVRIVSLVQRAVAAILYEVRPLDERTRVVVQSELVANEALPQPADADPRATAALAAPLVSETHRHHGQRAGLVHVTRASGLRVAAGMDHVIDGPPNTAVEAESDMDLGRVTVACDLAPGESLRLVKFVSYGWSSQRSTPALLDQVDAALAEAKHTEWDGLLSAQREALDDFWDRADVELDGDPRVQQAVRFGLFHAMQAGARAEGRCIPAKGLTGPGYDGHCFWDTETFVLPLLTYTVPDAAADALRWRLSTLPKAKARAEVLALEGAAFPWRTIDGEECSAYWPAGTAAFHIGADIADAVLRLQRAKEDEDFEREVGFELLVETARLWMSLGHHDTQDGFRIDGVTGPDEYSAVADNNVYTNLMAERNLRGAAEAAERHADRAEELGVAQDEIAAWRAAADAVVVPYDEATGVHQQAEGFTRHQEWDFQATPPDRYPLLLHYPYFELYRTQVVKQADLVLAMHLRGDCFSDEEKARNFAYYEARTVRDSSLSACTQSAMAAEVGHLDLAYEYLVEAALMDLDDLEHNSRDGVHIASLAGSWIAVVCGLGGMRDHGGALSFAPRLPPALDRLEFRLYFRGRRIRVEVRADEASYVLLAGPPLHVSHHDEEITVTTGEPVTRPLPDPPRPDPVSQPAGRPPAAR